MVENARLVGELNEAVDRLNLFQGLFNDYHEFRRLRVLEKDLILSGDVEASEEVKLQLRHVIRRLKEAFANLGDGLDFTE